MKVSCVTVKSTTFLWYCFVYGCLAFCPLLLRSHHARFRRCGISAIQKLFVDDPTGAHPLAGSRLLRETPHFVASVPYSQVRALPSATELYKATFEERSKE